MVKGAPAEPKHRWVAETTRRGERGAPVPTNTDTRRGYRHYCPSARTLEVVGEKWALLIVRDLLLGPQRFSDLRQGMPELTPKWLSTRLRELEAAGLVVRDQHPGRREVRYALTPKGRDLAPIIEALMAWGVEHALSPPEPGQPIHPGRAMLGLAATLNRRGTRLDRPATWGVDLGEAEHYALHWDGARWRVDREGADSDLRIASTPEQWMRFITADPEGRRRERASLELHGSPGHVAEFDAVFGPADDHQAACCPRGQDPRAGGVPAG